MKTHSSRQLRRVAWSALVCGLVTACASAPRPDSLQRAADTMASSEVERLAATRPNLVLEARTLQQQSMAAWNRGDAEVADLKAQMALQRVQTATHFEARDQTIVRQKAMQQALANLEVEVEQIGRENAALARFREADARFRGVEAELAQLRADDQSARARAQRAILDARRKQSQAIGVGAPTHAEGLYNQGRLLVDTALEALDNTLYAESAAASAQAIERFDAAIKAAGESDVALRRREQHSRDRENLAGEAQKVIDEAETARAAAIAARMPDKSPELYDKGVYLLDTARSRQEAGQYEVARDKAKDALATFRGGLDAADSPRSKARSAIAKAEDARSKAVGAGATQTGAFQQADYGLQLARQALEGGEFERATQQAEGATQLYQGLIQPGFGAMGAGAVAWTPAGVPGTAGPPQGAASAYRLEAERMVVALQFERAESLGRGLDTRCPAKFREFEALVDLARQRLDGGAFHHAVEFAVRANERIRVCEVSGPAATASARPAAGGGAAAVPTVDKGAVAASAADRRAADKAAVAIAEGQRRFARVSRIKGLEPKRLEEPALLLANAQSWFDKEAWGPAETLAGDASKVLDALEKELTSPVATDKGGRPATADKAAPGGKGAPGDKGAPAGKGKGKDDKTASVTDDCETYGKNLAAVRVAQASAGSRVASPDDEARYRRAISTVLSSERFAKDEHCAEANFLLGEASLVFESLTGSSASGAGGEPGPVSACPTLTTRTEDARLTQSIVLSRLSTAAQQDRYRRAERQLQSVDQLVAQQLCPQAEVALTEAEALLDGLGVSPKEVQAAREARQKEPVEAASKGSPEPSDDPAARAAAVEQIGRAEVLQAARAHARDANVYQVGSLLLGEARAALGAGRAAEAQRLATQAAYAFESLPAAAGDKVASKEPEPWKSAYNKVLDTLVAQQRAKDAARSEEERQTFGRGREFMDRARSAWDQKDYIAAERYAVAASDEFASVLRAAEARQKRDREAEAQKKELAEKDKALAARDKALAEKDEALADKERQEMARKAEREQLLRAADGLREADVARARCEEAGCERRDAALWASSQKRLEEARAALAKEQGKEAEVAATAAREGFDRLLAMPVVFRVPQGLSMVSASGDRLKTQPRIEFVTNRPELTPESQGAVKQLAQAIIANLDAIDRLSLVGYTDNRGNAARNLKLSQQRAESLRNALIALGVPGDRIDAAGRGSADPIADNGTAAGRAANRRIEIIVRLR